MQQTLVKSRKKKAPEKKAPEKKAPKKKVQKKKVQKKVPGKKVQKKPLLENKYGRTELPRYKRIDREKGDAGTVYAFRFKRTNHWVIIGKGWVGNVNELDFFRRYQPSNRAARGLFDKALSRYSPEEIAFLALTGRLS